MSRDYNVLKHDVYTVLLVLRHGWNLASYVMYKKLNDAERFSVLSIRILQSMLVNPAL